MPDRRALMADALALYDDSPFTERAFVHLRALLSDLPAVETRTPKQGTILDLGCGHGLLANLLALGSPERDVLGIDIDPSKIAAARRTIRGRTNIHFAVGDALDPPGGPYRAVTVGDVLYLLPAEAQRQVIAAAWHILEPGGLFVWKSQVRRPRWKYAITYGQEWLMTHVGPTKGATLCFLDTDESLAALHAAGFRASACLLPSRRPYSDMLFIGEKAAEPANPIQTKIGGVA